MDETPGCQEDRADAESVKIQRKRRGDRPALLLRLDLDRALATTVLLMSILLSIYALVIMGRAVYALFGISLSGACVIWLMSSRGSSGSKGRELPHKESLVYILAILFFLILVISILVFRFREDQYARPLSYFVLLSIMAGTVALEILLAPTKKALLALIMAQVLIIGFSLQYSQILLFPDVIGVDPAIHKGLVKGIVESGYLIEGADYSTTPLFHIILAEGSLIGDMGYKASTALIITFLEIALAPLLAYMLGRCFIGSKVGLLAALLVTIAPYHLYFGIWSVPNTFATIGIPLIIYLILRQRREKALTVLVLVLTLMVALILTHPVASIGLSILLLVLWSVQRIYRHWALGIRPRTMTLGLALFFLVFMLGWWTYVGKQIGYIRAQLITGFQIDYLTGVPEEVLTFVYRIPLEEQVFRYLGMFVFFLVSLYGCFYLLTKKYRNLGRFNVVTVGLIPLAAGFFSLAFALTGLDSRWFYLAELFLCIPLAVAVIMLYTGSRARARTGLAAFLLVGSIVLLSIANPSGSIDKQDLFPNTGVRYAFTESELSAASFISGKWDGLIASDFDYSTDISSSVFLNYHAVDKGRLMPLDDQLHGNNFTHDGSMKVIRSELSEHAVRVYALPYRLGYDPTESLTRSDFNRVFDNGRVSAFV